MLFDSILSPIVHLGESELDGPERVSDEPGGERLV